MSDKILVIGSGGREHALVWKLAQSKCVKEIFVLPGSYEIGKINKATNLKNINVNDFDAIGRWCVDNDIQLVVVGPEDPLANGITNVLHSFNINTFGPDREGALIEADKSWSKSFMKAWNIPTARYKSFSDVAAAKEFIIR